MHTLLLTLEQLHSSGERRLLLITGEALWCCQQAQSLWQEHGLWLGDGPEACRPHPQKQAQQRLGSEYSRVVFNGYSGVHPDMLGACGGMVQAGGLLILLMPPLASWPHFADPDLIRYVAQPEDAAACHSYYLQRLQHRLLASPTLWHWDQQAGCSLPSHQDSPPWLLQSDEWHCLSAEQHEAVAAILQCAQGHRQRPLVLTADRGRGKSAALGLAAGQLLQQHATQAFTILVTAPSQATTNTLFRHALTQCPSATQTAQGLCHGRASLLFFSPERVLSERPQAQLLLVDEAAAISTALLSELLTSYHRVVFSTTLHGYEGSGRGFALRMHKVLNQLTPGWHACHLSQPLRWAVSDPLEPLLADLLLLNADNPLAESTRTEPELFWCSQAQLAQDDTLLRQVFGLLVMAHYQTTPSDLRLLLDSPDLAILLLRQGAQLLGVALICREGELEPELAAQIHSGHRRPRGQLLPQTLLAHCGYAEAGTYRYARIMRIAIHPARQRSGWGRHMVQQLSQWASTQHFSFIGAALAATPELLPFWREQGFLPVRLGLSRDHASGTHSAILLKALQPEAQARASEWHNGFVQSLPHYLPRQWRMLPTELVSQLLSPTDQQASLSPQEWHDLHSVAYGLRSPDHALPALQRWLAVATPLWLTRPLAERELLIRYLWQGWSWQEIAGTSTSVGQKALIRQLRAILAACLPPA